MARKKVETPSEEQFDFNAAPNPLQAFFDKYPNANRLFKVGKYDGAQVVHLYSSNELPDEDQLQETYGGGRYLIRAFADGVQGGETEFRIADKPGVKPAIPTSAEDTSKKTDNIPMNDDSFIKQLLLKMVGMGANPAAAQPTPVSELAEALKTIHALSGNSGTNTAKEYAEGLKAGIELAKNLGAGGGETDWKTELFRMAKDVIPSIASSVASIATKSPMQPTLQGKSNGVPAEVIAIAGNGNMMDKLLFDGIQKLKPHALKNTPVDLIVDWVVSNAAEYQDFVRAAFSRSFESFATIDPEIGNEPFNKWFKALYDGLRSAFVPNDSVDDNNDGRNRDTGNDADDENISA